MTTATGATMNHKYNIHENCPLKQCRCCKLTLPLWAFYKQAKNKDGYAGQCGRCFGGRTLNRRINTTLLIAIGDWRKLQGHGWPNNRVWRKIFRGGRVSPESILVFLYGGYHDEGRPVVVADSPCLCRPRPDLGPHLLSLFGTTDHAAYEILDRMV